MRDDEIYRGFPVSEEVNKPHISKSSFDDQKEGKHNDKEEVKKASLEALEQDSTNVENDRNENKSKEDAEDLTMDKNIEHLDKNRCRHRYAKIRNAKKRNAPSL